MKYANYETKVAVVSKGASVSLPEMNVLYTDWDNKVIVQTSAVTSDMSVSGTGVTKRAATVNGGKGFILRATRPGVNVTIRPTGKDAEGNSVTGFGEFKYKVKPFPQPRLTIEQISRSSNTRLRVGLGQDSPLGNVEFDVLSGEVTIGADVMKFNGNVMQSSLLRKAKPGRDVAIFLRCKRRGSSKVVKIKGSITVTQ